MTKSFLAKIIDKLLGKRKNSIYSRTWSGVLVGSPLLWLNTHDGQFKKKGALFELQVSETSPWSLVLLLCYFVPLTA